MYVYPVTCISFSSTFVSIILCGSEWAKTQSYKGGSSLSFHGRGTVQISEFCHAENQKQEEKRKGVKLEDNRTILYISGCEPCSRAWSSKSTSFCSSWKVTWKFKTAFASKTCLVVTPTHLHNVSLAKICSMLKNLHGAMHNFWIPYLFPVPPRKYGQANENYADESFITSLIPIKTRHVTLEYM